MSHLAPALMPPGHPGHPTAPRRVVQSSVAPSHGASGNGEAAVGVVGFAEAARVITRATAQAGWQPPSFRCPPGLVGVDRSIRRRRQGPPIIAVRIKERPWLAVLADMIEGVVVANQLTPPDADRARNRLWEALGAAAGGRHDAAHRAA